MNQNICKEKKKEGNQIRLWFRLMIIGKKKVNESSVEKKKGE